MVFQLTLNAALWRFRGFSSHPHEIGDIGGKQTKDSFCVRAALV